VKDLTCEGLVDLSEFTPEEDKGKHANYGLVFIYRPFIGSWVQAVAMFLSHGPTKSCSLSQIILKVIIAVESHELLVSKLHLLNTLSAKITHFQV
jgi:hypothetical protein